MRGIIFFLSVVVLGRSSSSLAASGASKTASNDTSGKDDGPDVVNQAVKKMMESGTPFNAYLKLLHGEVTCGMSESRKAFKEFTDCYNRQSKALEQTDAKKKSADCKLLTIVASCLKSLPASRRCLTDKSRSELEEVVGKDAKTFCAT